MAGILLLAIKFAGMRYARLTLAILIWMCAFTAAHAQEVIYSPLDKFDFRNGDYSVVGMTGGYLYNYRSSPDGAMLEAFDDSMNKTATIILDFFPNKIYQTRFITYSDRIIILYQALESNKVVQYAALLDERGRLKGRPMELASVKTGIFGAMKNYFYSAVSEDKKKILVYTLNDKADGVEMEARWLDDSLKLLKRSKASYSNGKMLSKGEVNIANNGTVYMAAYIQTGAQNYASEFWILALKEGDNRFAENAMNMEGKYVASGYMKIDNLNSKVYFGGFYTGKKNGSYDGIIFSTLDMAANIYLNQKYIAFDQQLTAAATLRQKNHPFDNYVVNQLIVKNDGGFVLVSENTYITTRSNYMPGIGYYSSFYSPYNTTLVREYHYNDIMAISYNKDGVREWNSFVAKQQYSQEDGGAFASYVLLNAGGSLAFLFNDFNNTRSKIQLATMDADGKTEVSSFTPEGNNSPDWLPRAGKQVAARVLIIPCLLKKQICFAKVTF